MAYAHTPFRSMLDTNESRMAHGAAAGHDHTVEEVSLLRAQNAELKLQISRKSELVDKLTRQLQEVRSTGINVTPVDSDATRADGYSLRKENLALTQERVALTQEIQHLREANAALQRNLDAELRQARGDADHETAFLRSQLAEAKEQAGLLRERLAGHHGTSAGEVHQTEDTSAMPITERVLVASEAVFARVAADRPTLSSSSKARLNVDVQFHGRSLVLTGPRENVYKLKAELLETLSKYYAALVHPSAVLPASQAREAARTSEVEELRRTVATHEATIDSLHTAVRHAQERSRNAVADASTVRQHLTAEQHGIHKDRAVMELERGKLERKVQTLERSLAETERAAEMALQSLKGEGSVSQQLRAQVEELKRQLDVAADARELAERASYVAKEQAMASETSFTDLMRRASSADAETRRADAAEREARRLSDQAAAAVRERERDAAAAERERGRLEERVRRLEVEVSAIQHKAEVAESERRAVQQDFESATATIAELRHSATRADALGGTAAGGDVTSRLERENERLRRELQQCFSNMKAMAVAMQEARAVRERSVADVERLEMERNRLANTCQQTELQLVQLQMQATAKESTAALELETLKEECEHHKARAAMLHKEYQDRLAATLVAVEGGTSSRGPSTAGDVRSEANAEMARSLAVPSGIDRSPALSTTKTGAPPPIETVRAELHRRAYGPPTTALTTSTSGRGTPPPVARNAEDQPALRFPDSVLKADHHPTPDHCDRRLSAISNTSTTSLTAPSQHAGRGGPVGAGR